jgi:hypothetical protein
MFIKLHLQVHDAFKIFRTEDIIAIDPVICHEGIIRRYELVLANHKEVIAITTEQAHDLSLLLRCSVIHHPRQYE